MSNTSIVIFDWSGQFITELVDIPYTVSWVSNDWRNTFNSVGQLKFTISFNDPKFNGRNLQKGNLVYIPGTDGLPDWFGVLDEPYNWKVKELEIIGYSAEKILEWRKVNSGQVLNGTSGAIFSQLLNIANTPVTDDLTKVSYTGTIINAGNIWIGSSSMSENLATDVLKHARNVALNAQRSFDVTGFVDTNSRLNLQGNWYQNQGVMVPYSIEDNYIGVDPKIQEQGNVQSSIANAITGYGDSTGQGTRNVVTRVNSTSVSQYGLRSYNHTGLGVSDPASVKRATETKLAYSNQPVFPFSPEFSIPTTESGLVNLYPYFRIGNQFNVNLSTGGFKPDGTIGLQAVMYIMSMEYESISRNLKPAFEIYIPPGT